MNPKPDSDDNKKLGEGRVIVNSPRGSLEERVSAHCETLVFFSTFFFFLLLLFLVLERERLQQWKNNSCLFVCLLS